MDAPAARVVLYTVGHSNRDLASLVSLLQDAAIAVLVDIRAYPVSRRYPWFSREALAAALHESGIGYDWQGRALGGMRRARPDSPHRALAGSGMQGYADYMESAGFARAVDGLLERAAASRLCLMCAEKLPQQCHRQLLADYLCALRRITVCHLVDGQGARPHALSEAARPGPGGVLYYDRQATLELALS